MAIVKEMMKEIWKKDIGERTHEWWEFSKDGEKDQRTICMYRCPKVKNTSWICDMKGVPKSQDNFVISEFEE